MSVVDDSLRFIWMSSIIVHLFLKIREIRLYFYIMIVWLQSSFHKPSFIIWLRHHGDGIGRHNPFQIACHVISLQRHHVFVFQMVVDGNLVALPFWLNQIYGSDIEARISEKLLYKLHTDVLAGYFPSEDSLVFFFLQTKAYPSRR